MQTPALLLKVKGPGYPRAFLSTNGKISRLRFKA
ncbi:hypothetical protein AciX8_2894 [Granulicella mallensis MP5ACTX8]|uniref:Uncharacterized protein n=1 Tax=Granulicella mallensis (strain ATCC BAA-1857 / DSM 23137 / MP5ACTX8) TaxID=682795 RepID=G8NPV8_GRAMM|nr:hypothetical protein AciX8_2894 [Granulicella mallensis MP5ACTX8]